MHKETKTESDKKWASSHNLEKNNQAGTDSKAQKSSKDNAWVSTNKN